MQKPSHGLVVCFVVRFRLYFCRAQTKGSFEKFIQNSKLASLYQSHNNRFTFVATRATGTETHSAFQFEP